MNWRKTAIVMGAGAAGFGAFWLGPTLAIRAAFADWAFLGPSATSPGQLLVIFVVAPLLIWGGGTLAARALGAAWLRSAMAGLAAPAVALAIAVLLPMAGSPGYASYAGEAVSYVGAALTLTLVATGERGQRRLADLALPAGVTLVFVLIGFMAAGANLGWAVGLPAWMLIPATATLLPQT